MFKLFQVDGTDDARDYIETMEAMATMGMNDIEQVSFSILLRPNAIVKSLVNLVRRSTHKDVTFVKITEYISSVLLSFS